MNDDDVKRTLRELRHGIAECMRRLNSLEEQVYSLQHAQPKGISLVERIDRIEGILSRKDLL